MSKEKQKTTAAAAMPTVTQPSYAAVVAEESRPVAANEKRYIVNLPEMPTREVKAVNPEDAIKKYDVLCGIIHTVHEYVVQEVGSEATLSLPHPVDNNCCA